MKKENHIRSLLSLLMVFFLCNTTLARPTGSFNLNFPVKKNTTSKKSAGSSRSGSLLLDQNSQDDVKSQKDIPDCDKINVIAITFSSSSSIRYFSSNTKSDYNFSFRLSLPLYLFNRTILI
jgi:hypothetical protein